MEKQAKNTILMEEKKTTASEIAKEIFVLMKDEFICKAYDQEESGGVISLFNGQKFRFSVNEI